MAGKPGLNFSHQFSHNIWKIHAHRESSVLLLEIRNQDELKVSFTAIDISGKILADNIMFEESWWISVAQIIGRDVIFYTFDADGNPEVKDYIAYDLDKGEISWQKQDFSLANYIKPGEINENNKINIPFHYPEDTAYFNTVQRFIKFKLNDEARKGADYLEHDDLILLSYFKEVDKSMVNRLIVINKDQKIVMDEKLGEFNKGITDNTFFLFNNKLIFVKGISEFFIYQL